MKKTTGEILTINEIFEKSPNVVKNYGAFSQLYMDMAGRHRVRARSVQIMDVKEVAAKDCKRPYITEFHDSRIRFPLPHRVQRASERRFQQRFRPTRPTTVW